MYSDLNQDNNTLTHEELTLDDIDVMFMEENSDISSPGQVEGYLFAINKMNNTIDNLKKLKQQSVQFYSDRIERTEKTIEMLKVKVEIFMNTSKIDKIPTQAGTVYFTTRTKETFPEDDVLIEYSKQYAIDLNVKVSPNKRLIKEYIKNGGEVPPDYEANKVTSLSIRK
jgi:hypothetical protein